MKLVSIFVFILLFHCSEGETREPYHATLALDSATATVSAPNLLDLKRDLRTESIEKLIPLYTPSSPLSLAINLRGIDVLASFAKNSSTLVVLIPQAGITTTFTGATRDASIALFKDFIHDAGHGTTNHHGGKLLRAYARFSPIDPIAGNPNSLMAKMAEADYLLGKLSPLSGCDCCWSAQPIKNQYQWGADYGRAFSQGFDTTIIDLPLRFSHSPDLNYSFILDALLTYLRNGGASSLVGSLGVGMRFPIIFGWSLMPVLRFGTGGSLDLCTSGSFLALGLTSVYNLKLCNYVVSLTNYAGYFTSTNLWLTGVNFNYNLHNYVFKNGLSFNSCKGFTLWRRPINFSVSFIDTYFAREHLFLNHFDEIHFTVFTNYLNPCIKYDCLSLGLCYQFGNKHYRGYYVSVKYQY